MKRYIKSSYNNDGEFVPDDFTSECADKFKEDLASAIGDRYGRKYKDIIIDFDDEAYDGTQYQVQVILYNNKGKFLRDGYFKFNAYSDYWDETDFKSHIDQKIHNFVEALM